jgi:hypothetical protein
MNSNGIVIYNGYAQSFNTDVDDDCGGQDWTLWPLPLLSPGLPMTLDRRKKFNSFVVQINDLIKSAVQEIAADSSIKYKIGFSNWDPWFWNGVRGQFCDLKSTGKYPDSNQTDLQFFKRDTSTGDPDNLSKRRSSRDLLEGMSPSSPDAYSLTRAKIYSCSLIQSRNPRAVAFKKLNPRAPTPPSCPGDCGASEWIPISDSIGRNFHPNELGHLTIASFAVAEVMDLRAKQLGVDAPTCTMADKFTCWQTTGRRAYASADRMNENYTIRPSAARTCR